MLLAWTAGAAPTDDVVLPELVRFVRRLMPTGLFVLSTLPWGLLEDLRGVDELLRAGEAGDATVLEVEGLTGATLPDAVRDVLQDKHATKGQLSRWHAVRHKCP